MAPRSQQQRCETACGRRPRSSRCRLAEETAPEREGRHVSSKGHRRRHADDNPDAYKHQWDACSTLRNSMKR
eukprot:6189584-Pleurochrysis_carterae.AAC.1